MPMHADTAFRSLQARLFLMSMVVCCQQNGLITAAVVDLHFQVRSAVTLSWITRIVLVLVPQFNEKMEINCGMAK
jgi:hypothetical protein